MSDWRTEFQYLLDNKILNSAELWYLFGQIKSIIARETTDLHAALAASKEKILTMHGSIRNLGDENRKLCSLVTAKDNRIAELKGALEVAKGIIMTPYKRHNIATSLEKIEQTLNPKETPDAKIDTDNSDNR